MLKPLMRSLLAALFVLLAAPLVQAQSAYKIHPGDTLQFEVLEDSSLNRTLLVLPDGSVSVPMVGSVQAAGRSVDELRQSLAASLASKFATKPTVYLSVGQLAPKSLATTGVTMPVYITGQIVKSGRLDVDNGTTLLQAIAEGGGLTPFAAGKRILLRRFDRHSGKSQNFVYDYDAMTLGDPGSDIVLQPGDVIIVPQRRLFE